MRFNSFSINRIISLLSIVALVYPVFVAGATDTRPSIQPLTTDQKIIHVLNRLGFGSRPGDVERVKKIGLEKYIDQQLNPSAIDDALAESKVKGLEVFNMSTADMFAKYPNPGALLKQLEGGKRALANATPDTAETDAAKGDPDQALNTQQQQKERREKLAELYREYDLRPANQIVPQIVANRVLRAVYSERQLQEVMVDFWQNHFNVFAGKAAVRWYIPSYERDVLRPNALGNFKDLLIGTAKHPAMLFFLDNFQSVSPNASLAGPNRGGGKGLRRQFRNSGPLPQQVRARIMERTGMTDAELNQRMKQRGDAEAKPQKKRQDRGINENYARELMELHTLGVDGGYTQADIVEVAKCFTGWTIADPRGYRKSAANMIKGTEDRQLGRLQKIAGVPDDIQSGEFYFNSRWHERGAKTVLGHKIDDGGINDGLKVIDILVSSPATAKFIAKKLAVKFVSDSPSEALISRVADAFHRSNGDIKTTLRALFTDSEFYAPANYRAKIKTPFELAVSSIRAIGADTTSSPAFLAMLNKLGEVPYGYQAPTGYPDKAEDWVNTGALLERMNFAVAVASNRIPGTRVDLRSFDKSDRGRILDQALAVILNGEVSAATRSTLAKQLSQPLPDVKAGNEVDDVTGYLPNPRGQGQQGGGRRQARLLPPSGDPEVFKAVSLVLGSPEFQRQ